MIIYVLTQGAYSDYHIVTATTDKDQAEKLCKIFNKNNPYYRTEIEEYDSENYGHVKENKPVFHLTYDPNALTHALKIEEGYSSSDYDNVKNGPTCYYRGSNKLANGYVMAADQDTATKIFFDELAKKKAEMEGII